MCVRFHGRTEQYLVNIISISTSFYYRVRKCCRRGSVCRIGNHGPIEWHLYAYQWPWELTLAVWYLLLPFIEVNIARSNCAVCTYESVSITAASIKIVVSKLEDFWRSKVSDSHASCESGNISEMVQDTLVATYHQWEVSYGLRNRVIFDESQWHWRSFTCRKAFQVQIRIEQLCSTLKHLNWYSALLGPSALAAFFVTTILCLRS